MASFVREVLSATGRLGEKEDFSGKAARLRSSIDDLKAGLRNRIEARYSDFSASFTEVSQQIAQLEEVLREVDALENSIQHHLKPGLAEASRESGEILRQMKELSASTKAANRIRQVYEMMEAANEMVDRRHFTEACKKLKNVEDAIEASLTLDASAEQDEDIVKSFQSIKVELVTAQEKVRHVLCNEWDQLIRIENMDPQQPGDPEGKRIILGLEDGKEMLGNLVVAMHSSDTLSYRINKFGAKLMSEIVQSVMTRKVTSFDVFDDQHHFLDIKLDSAKSNSAPDPIDVLNRLSELFQFLGDSFNLPISETDSEKTLMECLGEIFGSKLKDLLIKECLGPSVPSSKEGLANYSAIIKATVSLQLILVQSRFFGSNSSSNDVLKYAQNVNSTFANKRCQLILVKGRELMKEDLHSATTVEHFHPPGIRELEETLLTENLDPSVEEEMLPLPKGMSLDRSVFEFPKCQISQTTLKIVSLIKETLEEACAEDATPFYSGRLLVTARNLVEMYCDVIPVFHAESLRQFPQLSALAYNNFFFLAHECLTLGLLCSDRLKPPFNSRAVTFADLAPSLRQTGVDVFLQQMRRQRDDLRAVLKDSSTGFGQLTGSELLPSQSEKSIRQVLHQLNHLRRLWQDVLPPNVYCKSMGTIFNTVVDELILKVIPLEDIAADAATQLCSLFTTLQEKGPDIFVLDGQPDSSRGDVVRYVRKWNKFKELILILNASLREIEDRWAGGKGPLAVEYSPEEVKRLIRALFQNSDRRAAVLARIKFEA